MSLASKCSLLKKRAEMLAKVRAFFAKRHVLEVDTPALSHASSIDAHIDPMFVHPNGYLHTSPEYGMKRLLAEGSGDIYQLSHVFRCEEIGRLHNPEFMLLEWYRVSMPLTVFIEETLELCGLFCPSLPYSVLSYEAAFKRHLDLDIRNITVESLTGQYDIPPSDDLDTLLNYLWGIYVEPELGQGEFTVITPYPASQAALSQVVGEHAMRFEIYHLGIELANGYQELTDAKIQEERLINENKKRVLLGKEPLPIDMHFVNALKSGLPPCCGVAVGFDRLLMLHLKASSLDEVLPIS